MEDGLNEAVRTGTCTLAGRPIWLAAFDFRFVGGTLSIVAGERLARGMEQAAGSGIPYVLIAASGGAAARPINWLENSTPERWQANGKAGPEWRYRWNGKEGASAFLSP